MNSNILSGILLTSTLLLGATPSAVAETIRIDATGSVWSGFFPGDRTGAPTGFSIQLDGNQACGAGPAGSPIDTGSYCVYNAVEGRAYVDDVSFELSPTEWDSLYVYAINDWDPEPPSDTGGAGEPYDAFGLIAFRELGDVQADGSAFESLHFGFLDLTATVFDSGELAELPGLTLAGFDIAFMDFIAEASNLGEMQAASGYFADVHSLSATVVPIPPAALLFGSAIMGLTLRRRPCRAG